MLRTDGNMLFLCLVCPSSGLQPRRVLDVELGVVVQLVTGLSLFRRLVLLLGRRILPQTCGKRISIFDAPFNFGDLFGEPGSHEIVCHLGMVAQARLLA